MMVKMGHDALQLCFVGSISISAVCGKFSVYLSTAIKVKAKRFLLLYKTVGLSFSLIEL